MLSRLRHIVGELGQRVDEYSPHLRSGARAVVRATACLIAANELHRVGGEILDQQIRRVKTADERIRHAGTAFMEQAEDWHRGYVIGSRNAAVHAWHDACATHGRELPSWWVTEFHDLYDAGDWHGPQSRDWWTLPGHAEVRKEWSEDGQDEPGPEDARG